MSVLVVVLQSCYLNNDLFPFVFFFQAEDGIRDLTVTGVQTCALPISGGIPLVPTQASILSHSRAPSTPRTGHIGKESENAAGEKADTFGGNQCDPLQRGLETTFNM